MNKRLIEAEEDSASGRRLKEPVDFDAQKYDRRSLRASATSQTAGESPWPDPTWSDEAESQRWSRVVADHGAQVVTR